MLAPLNDEFDAWEALLGGLSEARITAPAPPDNLSIKDVLAHPRAWLSEPGHGPATGA